jgi:hypothetical protein
MVFMRCDILTATLDTFFLADDGRSFWHTSLWKKSRVIQSFKELPGITDVLIAQ